MGEVTKRVTRKNKELESTRPLTISAQDGLVDQQEYFKKQVASRDVSNYYLVKRGELAYNKSYSNGYPWGAIKRLDYYPDGVLSTLYIVFSPIMINSNFLVSYYDTTYWHREVSKHAAEGARNHGLLNIPASDFFKTEIKFPSADEEQIKIGNFFKKLDETITLQERQLELLKEQKKGFLQKMFPKENEKVPELRFEGFTDDWEQRKFTDIVIRVNKSSSSDKLPKVEFEDILAGEGRLNKDVTEKFDSRKGIEFEPKDILYGKLRPYLKNWLYPNFKGVALGDFWVFRSTESESIFVYSLIQANKFQKVANDTSGTKMPRSDWKKVSNTVFLIPNIEEQTKIGNFFKQLDKTITLQERQLQKMKEMKIAFLQKMFI